MKNLTHLNNLMFKTKEVRTINILRDPFTGDYDLTLELLNLGHENTNGITIEFTGICNLNLQSFVGQVRRPHPVLSSQCDRR